MGIFGLFKNRAEKWQDWTVKVTTKPDEKDAKKPFEITSEHDVNSSVFMEKFEDIAKDFIKQYDEDDDGKITYEEFEKYEENQLKENADDIDEETLKKAKAELKRIYQNLNLNNESDSKDALDKGEIMNMFYTMAGSNGYVTEGNGAPDVDGYISQYEYKSFTEALSYGNITPETIAQAKNKIDTAVQALDFSGYNLTEEQKNNVRATIKNEAMAPFQKNYNILQFLKDNYNSKFKDFK